jgi:NAD dependent epimerase/dehydratase family enzyme
MPWISLTDEIDAIVFCLTNGAVKGPVNLTGPDPVTNSEFTRVLARIVRRPALLAVPAVALRLVLGEFSSDVLEGQRAVPDVLIANGFAFTHETLDSALRAAI